MRTGHSLSVIGLPNNPTAVIIGGCTADGVVNDVYTMKMGQETLEWNKAVKIGQPDQAPSPRWRHTATVLRAFYCSLFPSLSFMLGQGRMVYVVR